MAERAARAGRSNVRFDPSNQAVLKTRDVVAHRVHLAVVSRMRFEETMVATVEHADCRVAVTSSGQSFAQARRALGGGDRTIEAAKHDIDGCLNFAPIRN